LDERWANSDLTDPLRATSADKSDSKKSEFLRFDHPSKRGKHSNSQNRLEDHSRSDPLEPPDYGMSEYLFFFLHDFLY
jgi:hypothetical protein